VQKTKKGLVTDIFHEAIYPQWLLRLFAGAVLMTGMGLALIVAGLVLVSPDLNLGGSLICAGGTLSIAYALATGEYWADVADGPADMDTDMDTEASPDYGLPPTQDSVEDATTTQHDIGI
jgi:hypothetical protein